MKFLSILSTLTLGLLAQVATCGPIARQPAADPTYANMETETYGYADANNRVWTNGLSSCIVIAAIGRVGDTPQDNRKIMMHLGAMRHTTSSGDRAIEAFLREVEQQGFREGSLRVTISHPRETYVEYAMMHDADFRAQIEALGGDSFARGLQRTLNDLVAEAREDVAQMIRWRTGGNWSAHPRTDPMPSIIRTPGTHEIRADGSEWIDEQEYHSNYSG